MGYVCPICGNSHDTTGCPTPMIYGRPKLSNNSMMISSEMYDQNIATARRESYLKALDDLVDKLINSEKPYLSRTVLERIIRITKSLKSAYKEGAG
jgi:hypothetical protein